MASSRDPLFVYILTKDYQSPSALRVKSYFSHPFFTVILTTIDVPEKYIQLEDSYRFV